MHHRLCEMVETAGGHVAGIFYCPHTPEDQCDCRKPKSGLIDAIEREFNTSARGAWMIGDSKRDLEAGLSKHCVPVLVLTGKGASTQQQLRDSTDPQWRDLRVFADLAAAADALIASQK
jgi:D-glycero-D-manno-heptose 1,7-bisphosphate phosphatase